MKEIQDGQLAFVARFFQAGRFDTASAWRQFSRAHGLRRRGRIGGRRYPARPAGRPVTWGYALALTGAFAALALGIFLFERSAWTTVPQAASAQTIILPDRTESTLAPGSTLRFRRRGNCPGKPLEFMVKHNRVEGDIDLHAVNMAIGDGLL